MMRTYRDYCRPAQPIERTAKQPGELVYNSLTRAFERLPESPRVVPMRRKGR